MAQPNRKRRWYRLAAILLLLLIGYGSYRAIRPDPNLKKVKQLREEFTAHAKDWTPEQRQEKGKQMREAMDHLSPAQRDTLAAEGRKRFEEQLRQYAQMTPQQKTQHLDEQINRSEQARQQMAQRNANGGPPTGPGTFGSGPRGPGGPGGAGAGGGPGGQQMSAEEREKRRKERLDQTTPEFRALMDQYRKDMNARRQQRGLPVSQRG